MVLFRLRSSGDSLYHRMRFSGFCGAFSFSCRFSFHRFPFLSSFPLRGFAFAIEKCLLVTRVTVLNRKSKAKFTGRLYGESEGSQEG